MCYGLMYYSAALPTREMCRNLWLGECVWLLVMQSCFLRAALLYSPLPADIYEVYMCIVVLSARAAPDGPVDWWVVWVVKIDF